MVIQRIQTLFLLVAAALMIVLPFCIPIMFINADGGVVSVYAGSALPLLIIQLLAAILYLVAIFLFKNLPLQMRVTRISMVLTVVAAIIQGYLACTQSEADANILAPAIMYVAVLILASMALRGMSADQKLLRSYDRLR